MAAHAARYKRSLSTESSSLRWLLVTGQPGCGKTTMVKAMVEACKEKGLRLTGFYTDEVLGADGSRQGFDVVTVGEGGKRGVLSRKSGLPSGLPKTGTYSVDVASFEKIALPTLQHQQDSVIVVDEIGRMELHSHAFQRALEALCENPSSYVIGAVTAPIYGHRVPFCDAISAQPFVCVHKITPKSRDSVKQEVLACLDSILPLSVDESFPNKARKCHR